ESYLAEAQRLSHSGSWGWNIATWEITHWSQEIYRLYGFDPEAGIPSFEAHLQRIHSEDRAGLAEALKRAIGNGAEFELVFKIALPDGATKYIHKIGHPVYAAGGIVEFVGTDMDITERKRGEAEIRESERRYREVEMELAHANRVATMGQLSASIAHEVNQPITAAVTNAYAALRWLDRQPPHLEEARQALARIVKDGNRAGDVIGRIRELIKKAPPRQDWVDINEAIREGIELTRPEAVKTGVFGMGVVRHQEDRAERRAQCQRDETGDYRRGGDGGRERREEQARNAGDEGRRDEDGTQRQRDGDQRAGHFIHRVMRRLARRHTERHVALDVLDHDDRVVDHDAHRQHETEQREVVDRDAERGEDRKGADQRYRDSDQRDDRCPPALQEQVDDADHEKDRDADRHDHFVDGLAHEGGRVVDVDVIETGREALLELRHLVPHLVLHLNDIRARRRDDPERGGGITIRVGDRAVVHRAQLDATDVANTGDPSLRVRLHDDVAELLGRGEAPKRANIDLVGPARVVEDRR